MFDFVLMVTDTATNVPVEAIEEAVTATTGNSQSTVQRVSLMSSREFWLSVGIMVFGLVVIAGQLFYVRGTDENGRRAISSESAIRLTIVSMIIVGALVLISSGYSDKQIGPAMGLFGTVAGYLIGRQDK